MISEKMDNLFTQKPQRILVILSIFFCFMCIFLVRYFQHDSSKIIWLYAMYACIMFLIVLYKNSINKYEIAIFCFLGIQLLAVVPRPEDISPLTFTSYLLSYRYGISSRSLVATIVDFFTAGGFISWYFIWHFMFSSTIFISFIISVCIGTAIQKTMIDTKQFLILLSLIYLSCFTAPVAYFVRANFGRIEIFTIPILVLITQIINRPVIRWLIPLLATTVVATHLILAFFYIPFIVILLLYEILRTQKISKGSVLLFGVTILTLLTVLFCYLLFAKGTFTFENAFSFYEYLRTRTNLNFSEHFLHFTMFASLGDHLAGWRDTVNLRFQGNVSILINIPLICLFVIFWLKCFDGATKKTMKFFFLLPILTLLYQALAFFLFSDFGRWMIMVLNVQFMLVFYLVYIKNDTVQSVAQLCITTAIPFLKRNIFFVVLLCFIIVFLGPVNHIGSSYRVMRLFNFVMQLNWF